MLAMLAAVARPHAAILADQAAALKWLPAIHAVQHQAAALKSLLAILVQLLLAIADAALESVMAVCSASCSVTRAAAMSSLAMLAQPPVARPAMEALLLQQLQLQHLLQLLIRMPI
ncbi:MAG: hypothetical protein MUF23_04100 [Pirellula sp.]|jgi:hypothetical protein|nr:hypothetical protein [Pirellula sp.]